MSYYDGFYALDKHVSELMRDVQLVRLNMNLPSEQKRREAVTLLSRATGLQSRCEELVRDLRKAFNSPPTSFRDPEMDRGSYLEIMMDRIESAELVLVRANTASNMLRSLI